ncbi:hypothetical protein ABE438_15490 [Bosea sp. TWI1241]|uniref:hypothetical protein n=1 Tax=Bosea sp. TWI1241 TaxID=3148904 RepID=UPI003207A87F
MLLPGLTQLALLLACGLLGGCVGGGEAMRGDGPVDIVSSGTPTLMPQTYMTMDRRCRPQPRPSAVVTEPPRHGRVRMLTRDAAAVYGPGAYAHCDGRIGRSLAFEYTSAPGYRGPDGFAVRVRYTDGETRTGRFAITLR